MRRLPTRIVWLLGLATMIAALTPAVQAQPEIFQFSAVLTGEQEVPKVVTAAMGVGEMAYDFTSKTFDLDIFVVGIPRDRLTASHIHLAPRGVNGRVIFNLGDGSEWFDEAGGVRRVVVGAMFPEEHESALLMNETYLNVHTPQNPAGEVRGQLELEIIPEPCSVALASLGLAGIVIRRRAGRRVQ